ncbi:MAG: DNA alkylation repair protein [Saprospirales bacterium]|nr:MAG: DNA alkylation repair protein [Saprospirales bacterium]
MNPTVLELKRIFQSKSDPATASGQEAYMKNHFPFFGIKTPVRRQFQKPILKIIKAESALKRSELIKELWMLPQREFQYFGQELVFEKRRQIEPDEIDLIKYMVANKSWWDTVDYIASKIAGHYFMKYPEKIQTTTRNWIQSGNIWLIRTAILFQLHYKEKTDTQLLEEIIKSQVGTEEFFINKAIGWVLRQYSRTNPHWVRSFADRTELHPLSRREGLKYC